MKTADIEVDDRTAIPKEATTPQELMDSLLAFDAVPAPVISLYLDARVNEHGKRVFMPFVRKQLSVPDTLAALSNGQVEEMLIVAAADGLKFDEEEVRKVLDVYKADDIPETLDARTVADELVRRANQLSAARVTFVEDVARLEQLGGVGALLRYRISEENAAPYEQSDAVPRSRAISKSTA
jgi:hypothetical protein